MSLNFYSGFQTDLCTTITVLCSYEFVYFLLPVCFIHSYIYMFLLCLLKFQFEELPLAFHIRYVYWWWKSSTSVWENISFHFFLKDSFDGYTILVWLFFSLSSLSISSHCFLSCSVARILLLLSVFSFCLWLLISFHYNTFGCNLPLVDLAWGPLSFMYLYVHIPTKIWEVSSYNFFLSFFFNIFIFFLFFLFFSCNVWNIYINIFPYIFPYKYKYKIFRNFM